MAFVPYFHVFFLFFKTQTAAVVLDELDASSYSAGFLERVLEWLESRQVIMLHEILHELKFSNVQLLNGSPDFTAEVACQRLCLNFVACS